MTPPSNVIVLSTDVTFLNKFDFIAIGIFNKGYHCSAMHHGARFTHYLTTYFSYCVARFVSIIYFQSDMSISFTHIVALGTVIIGKF